MLTAAFPLDTKRQYEVLDLLVQNGAVELWVRPTANYTLYEPTWRLDNWKKQEPFWLWDYVRKCYGECPGLYWVAGVYGLYNIDKEKISIGSSILLRKRWSSHISSQKLSRKNELQHDLSKGNRFLFCLLETTRVHPIEVRKIWWHNPPLIDYIDCTRLRKAEQKWMERIPKSYLYNKRKAYDFDKKQAVKLLFKNKKRELLTFKEMVARDEKRSKYSQLFEDEFSFLRSYDLEPVLKDYDENWIGINIQEGDIIEISQSKICYRI